MRGWSTANCMNLNISKSKIIPFSRKTNFLIYEYTIYQYTVTRIGYVKTWEYFLILNLISITMSNTYFLTALSCWLQFMAKTSPFQSYLCTYYNLHQSDLRLKMPLLFGTLFYSPTDSNKLKLIQQNFTAVFSQIPLHLFSCTPHVKGGITLIHSTLFQFNMLVCFGNFWSSCSYWVYQRLLYIQCLFFQ